MPFLSVARFFTTLLSLLVLGAASYLLWSWYQGEMLVQADGDLLRSREPWRLWAGLGLMAVSFLGRPLVTFLLARPDERPTRPERGAGDEIAGANGATLYVETHGPAGAPPIIFTHGWGMDSTFWNYAKRDLADRFRLVLWDLPGMGRSQPAGPGQISLEAFAADLATLIQVSGRQPAVLVGHSIGGMTIQTLVRDHPEIADRIAGVVLLNTTHTNPLRTMILSGLMRALQKPVLEPAMKLIIVLHPLVRLSQWQSYLSGSSHLAHRLGFGKFVTRSQLEHVTLLSTRNPPAAQARGNLAMFGWDATGALGRLRAPVLVIGGDKDIVTKLEASRTMAADAHSGTLQVIEDVNHLGPMERADRYNQLIADFALSVQPSATLDTRPADDRPFPLEAGADDGDRAAPPRPPQPPAVH